MKVKAKRAKRKAGKKGSLDQATPVMKAVDKLEAIKAKLVQKDNGHNSIDADVIKSVIKSSSLNVDQESRTPQKLIIQVVHVDDNGNRIEPTEEQRELDRKIEGHHGKD